MHNEKIPADIAFPHIAQELESMVDTDQDMREKNLEDGEFWDDSIDKNNTERMKVIVSEIGWPTRSKVGEQGMNDAWLLVQHADHDVGFQSFCLNLMKAESADEVDKKYIAYLEDRVRLALGKSQLYGTQFRENDGKFGPRPIEDEEHVNERRAEMGMQSMEEYTKIMHQKYGMTE